MEPEVADHFEQDTGRGAAFTRDLRTRILPKLVPMYLRSLCQRPDRFVELAVALHEMWPGEDLTYMGATIEHR